MGQRCQRWGKLNHKPPTPKPNLHPICGLCTVGLDSVCLPLLPDAAVCRSLFKSTVLRLFLQQTIKAGAEELYGYGHKKIGMVGTANFQVSCHGTKLLGFDLFCVLGFSITDNMGSTKLTITTSWQHCWLSLFTWLDCLTTFNHQPLNDSAVSRVIQTLHRLPQPLRRLLASSSGSTPNPGFLTWWWQRRSRPACNPVLISGW